MKEWNDSPIEDLILTNSTACPLGYEMLKTDYTGSKELCYYKGKLEIGKCLSNEKQ